MEGEKGGRRNGREKEEAEKGGGRKVRREKGEEGEKLGGRKGRREKGEEGEKLGERKERREKGEDGENREGRNGREKEAEKGGVGRKGRSREKRKGREKAKGRQEKGEGRRGRRWGNTAGKWERAICSLTKKGSAYIIMHCINVSPAYFGVSFICCRCFPVFILLDIMIIVKCKDVVRLHHTSLTRK